MASNSSMKLSRITTRAIVLQTPALLSRRVFEQRLFARGLREREAPFLRRAVGDHPRRSRWRRRMYSRKRPPRCARATRSVRKRLDRHHTSDAPAWQRRSDRRALRRRQHRRRRHDPPPKAWRRSRRTISARRAPPAALARIHHRGSRVLLRSRLRRGPSACAGMREASALSAIRFEGESPAVDTGDFERTTRRVSGCRCSSSLDARMRRTSRAPRSLRRRLNPESWSRARRRSSHHRRRARTRPRRRRPRPAASAAAHGSRRCFIIDLHPLRARKGRGGAGVSRVALTDGGTNLGMMKAAPAAFKPQRGFKLWARLAI